MLLEQEQLTLPAINAQCSLHDREESIIPGLTLDQPEVSVLLNVKGLPSFLLT